MPRIKEGMARSGRRRESFEVTGGGFVATGATDGEVAKAVEWVRYRVAFYGSTPGYWPVLDLHGLGDLGRKLNRMTKEGAWDRIAAEIDDDTVRLFAAVGRHDELAAAVAERFGGAADTIYASLSMDLRPDLPPDLIQDIRRLPAASRATPPPGDLREPRPTGGVCGTLGPAPATERAAAGRQLVVRSLRSPT